MIKIPLSKLNHQSRGEMVACSWGIHDDILILEAEQIPERIDGMFVPAQADKRSWFVTVYQGGELLFTLPAVESKTNFHYVQRVGDDQILLVGARCHYNEGKPDKNAALYNHYGQLINRFTLGDGIEQVNVTASNEVWVGYFDEGVFGNYGWGQPLGQYGLVKFDLEGHILWQADQFEILDCYAVNAEAVDRFGFITTLTLSWFTFRICSRQPTLFQSVAPMPSPFVIPISLWAGAITTMISSPSSKRIISI
ncbi:hypothetical protein [Budvicia aquatica]|uniref:Uncharacterized protein n=1 Tax=Budvicia aquatica TaxID=82979 RepID=A0A484ZY48_9GAMM|nr:hypothetical protein [Budvicia aquatica]VFS52911.1 Uncharacterised protein [Budvicia aquatica]